MTPSRAFFTIGDFVSRTFGEPSLFGIRSRTAMAHDACGFGGPPTTSIRHMRQLPAIDSRSWKQKRGISAPAASHACSSVYSGGTSISRSSTMSLVMRRRSLLGLQTLKPFGQILDTCFQGLVSLVCSYGYAQGMRRNFVKVLDPF